MSGSNSNSNSNITSDSNSNPPNNSQTGKVVAGTGISLILLYVCSTVLNFWGIPIGSYAPYLVFIIFIIMIKIIIPDKLFVTNNSQVTSNTGISPAPLQQYIVDTSHLNSNSNSNSNSIILQP